MKFSDTPANYLSTQFTSDALRTCPAGTYILADNFRNVAASLFEGCLEMAANAAKGVDVVKKTLVYGKKHDGHTNRITNGATELSMLDYFYSRKGNDDELHALVGIISEAGELAEALHDAISENRELDRVNVVEEVGDIMWYMAVLCRAYGITMDDIAYTNHKKLKVRYGDKFTTEAALNRDLSAERAVLEGRAGQVSVSYEGTLLATGPNSSDRIDVV